MLLSHTEKFSGGIMVWTLSAVRSSIQANILKTVGQNYFKVYTLLTGNSEMGPWKFYQIWFQNGRLAAILSFQIFSIWIALGTTNSPAAHEKYYLLVEWEKCWYLKIRSRNFFQNFYTSCRYYSDGSMQNLSNFIWKWPTGSHFKFLYLSLWPWYVAASIFCQLKLVSGSKSMNKL